MVISLLIILGGLMSLYSIPVAEYPEVAPPDNHRDSLLSRWPAPRSWLTQSLLRSNLRFNGVEGNDIFQFGLR